MVTHETLGLILVRNGVLTRPQLYDALRLQRHNGRLLGTCLIELGYLESDQLLSYLSEQLGLAPCTKHQLQAAEPTALERLSGETARGLLVIPFAWDDTRLRLAVANGAILPRTSELAIEARCQIAPFVALESDIEEALERYYPDETNTAPGRGIDQAATRRARPAEIAVTRGPWLRKKNVGSTHESQPAQTDVIATALSFPKVARPPSDPPLERLGLYDAVEQVYEAHDPASIGRCLGRAMLNYFDRVIVLHRLESTFEVVGYAGVMPQFSILDGTPAEQLRDSCPKQIEYDDLDALPVASTIASALRIGRAPVAFCAPIGEALLIYADNDTREERYEELADVAMLCKEGQTAIGLLQDADQSR